MLPSDHIKVSAIMGVRIKAPPDLAALVRSRRKSLGWDQAELARRIGTNRRWVSELENAKPTVALHLVLKALNALGIDILTELRGASQPDEYAPATEPAHSTSDRPVQKPSANDRSLEEQIRQVNKALKSVSRQSAAHELEEALKPAFNVQQQIEEQVRALRFADEVLNAQRDREWMQNEARLLDGIKKGRR